MIRQVYETLKLESIKGDFIDLIQRDMIDLKIDMTEEDILNIPKMQWKKLVSSNIKDLALEYLIEENSTKSKTRHIIFETLEMRDYLVQNRNTALSKVIFSVRSGTFDIKTWNEWKYENLTCFMCDSCEETFPHFMSCLSYGKSCIELDWKDIFDDDPEKQNTIAVEVNRRKNIRKTKI